jgi:hypothetical protein
VRHRRAKASRERSIAFLILFKSMSNSMDKEIKLDILAVVLFTLSNRIII